ncbi:hypothetical protein T492DRAFT_859877 [Pavlovales sp. CCMP2436]|nr:hypothetical protein T492DRAFT_859877 [Pavlovales sp. CCMP2436]
MADGDDTLDDTGGGAKLVYLAANVAMSGTGAAPGEGASAVLEVVLESSKVVAHLAEAVARREGELNGQRPTVAKLARLTHALLRCILVCPSGQLPGSGGSEQETAITVGIVVCVLVLSLASFFCALIKGDAPGGAGKARAEAADKSAANAGQLHTHRLPRKLEDVLELRRAEGWSALRHFILRMQSSEDDRRRLFTQLPRVTAKVFGLEGTGWQQDVQIREDKHALLELLMPPLPTAAGASGLATSSAVPGSATRAHGGGSPATPVGRVPPGSAVGGRNSALGSAEQRAANARSTERAAAKEIGGIRIPDGLSSIAGPLGGGAAAGAAGGTDAGSLGPGVLFAQIFNARSLAEQRRFTFFVRKLPAPMHAAMERRQLEQAAQSNGQLATAAEMAGKCPYAAP